MEADADFRAIPRLRWRMDSDGCPIATSRAKSRGRDHLYFHGPGVVGLYVERSSPYAFGHAVKGYRRQATVFSEQLGDCDGILFISPSRIPETFFRGKQRSNLPAQALADHALPA